MQVIIEEGLPIETLPTEDMRKVLEWASDYYYASGCLRAPSVTAFQEEFGLDYFLDHDIDVTDTPEDTVEWAIDHLKGDHLLAQSQDFTKRFAIAMNEVGTADRIAVVNEAADELVGLALRLARHSAQVDLREGIVERVRAFEARKELSESGVSSSHVLQLGFPDIDSWTGGVHPGELAVLAAGPKTGKSFMLAYNALSEWRRGRGAILFTLENSVEMTLDRIACLATNVPPRLWERGEATEEHIEKVREFQAELAGSDTPLWVVSPERERRTMEHMVREATVRSADSLLIDQLTFVDPPDARSPRWVQIRDMMHDLKELISTSRRRMPCLLAHQVSREGMAHAHKHDELRMEFMAEGSEVERTSDLVFGMYQSDHDRTDYRAKFQLLAGRRVDLMNWRLAWNVGHPEIRSLGAIGVGN